MVNKKAKQQLFALERDPSEQFLADNKVTLREALDNDVHERFAALGIAPAQLHTAYKTHPIVDYISSLDSRASQRKMLNVLRNIAVKLDADGTTLYAHKDAKNINIFTYDWHTITADRFSYLLNNLTILNQSTGEIAMASAATKSLYLAAMRGLFKVCARSEIISMAQYMSFMLLNVKAPDREPKGRYVSQSDRNKLLALGAKSEHLSAIRDQAIIALLVHNGLRRSEIGLIQWSDIDHNDQSLLVRGKGDKHVRIPLLGNAYEAIERYATLSRPAKGDVLFYGIDRHGNKRNDTPLHGSSVRYILKQCCKKAGISPIAPHDLRRSFCTDMINKHDVHIAQLYMRHSSSDTTQIYNQQKYQQMMAVRN